MQRWKDYVDYGDDLSHLAQVRAGPEQGELIAENAPLC